MKTNFCIKFVALMCMCISFYSCKDEVNHVDFGFSYSANFTVANITTGEQIKNKGLQLIGTETMIVHQGDILLLSYAPPTKYEKYAWQVSIGLFGETITGNAPFTTEYTVGNIENGEYRVTCNGVIVDSDVNFEGSDYGYVYLKVERE